MPYPISHQAILHTSIRLHHYLTKHSDTIYIYLTIFKSDTQKEQEDKNLNTDWTFIFLLAHSSKVSLYMYLLIETSIAKRTAF